MDNSVTRRINDNMRHGEGGIDADVATFEVLADIVSELAIESRRVKSWDEDLPIPAAVEEVMASLAYELGRLEALRVRACRFGE